MVKRKINWAHTSYDAVAENSFKSFTYRKELKIEIFLWIMISKK